MPRLETQQNFSGSESDLKKNHDYSQDFIHEHHSKNFEMKIRKDESRRESIFVFSGKKNEYTYATSISMLQPHPQFVNEINNTWITWKSEMA